MLSNISIGKRLGIAFALVLGFMLFVASVGYRGIVSVGSAGESVYEDNLKPINYLARIQYLAQRNRVLVMDMIMNPDPDNVSRCVAEEDQNSAAIEKAWAEYVATERSAEEIALSKELEAAMQAYRVEGLLPAKKAVQNGSPFDALNIYKEKISKLAPKFFDPLARLMESNLAQAADSHAAAIAVEGAAGRLLVAIAVLALFIGVWLALANTRSITAPLAQAVAVTKAVAQGDLSTRIPVQGKDEVSQMMHALHNMQESLARVVSSVRQGSERVAASSAEIAMGNSDLSARTEQQAAAIEETNAAMSELGCTVGKNADAASQANLLATNASSVAVRGGEVVGRVVDTMKDINQSSRKIADIISVIDGIAFQTNILALNAAVEAARAGEHGRGFAVVASEVRSLSGRSAEAAKEIKVLISASVEKVGQGTTLVDQAGSTMNEVVTSIRRVSEIMAEISTASHEQSLGASQIGEAIRSMDQTTQQNAALVEEMAAAASSLKTQAQELVETVTIFKFADGHQASVEVSLLPQPTVSKPFAG